MSSFQLKSEHDLDDGEKALSKQYCLDPLDAFAAVSKCLLVQHRRQGTLYTMWSWPAQPSSSFCMGHAVG